MPDTETVPIGDTQRMEVQQGRYPDESYVTVLYERREDGWYVGVPSKGIGYTRFASKDARKIDVKQLVNKKWDSRYTDPDPFELD